MVPAGFDFSKLVLLNYNKNGGVVANRIFRLSDTATHSVTASAAPANGYTVVVVDPAKGANRLLDGQTQVAGLALVVDCGNGAYSLVQFVCYAQQATDAVKTITAAALTAGGDGSEGAVSGHTCAATNSPLPNAQTTLQSLQLQTDSSWKAYAATFGAENTGQSLVPPPSGSCGTIGLPGADARGIWS